MEYLKNLKSKKVLIGIVGIVIIIGISGFYLNSQKLPTYEIIIKPTELLPYATHQQARTNVCNIMKEGLFEEICQKEFDNVGRNDSQKIGELFLLLKKVEEDRSIYTYDKLLLSQSIFASLPTKDSPLAQHPGFSTIASNLNNFVNQKNIAYAKEPNDNAETDEEKFIKMMEKDLRKMIKGLPEGNNAWDLSVIISKHEWIDGERQPIYSEQYVESFNPYPGTRYEDKSGWEQYDSIDVQFEVGSYMTSKYAWTGPNYEGSGSMIGYALSLHSWNSKPFGEDSVLVLAETGPPELYMVSSYHLTENGYKGDDFLAELMNTIAMPSRDQVKGKKDNIKYPHKFTKDECQKIADVLPVFHSIWQFTEFPSDSCVISSDKDSIIAEEDFDIEYANFSLMYLDPKEIEKYQEYFELMSEPSLVQYKRSEFEILEGKGKAIVLTGIRNLLDSSMASGGSSQVSISFGNCSFGYAGTTRLNHYPGRYDAYHQWDSSKGVMVDAHPGSDHGTDKLHQMMVDLVNPISEEIKSFCKE